jgi:hypothetical protein
MTMDRLQALVWFFLPLVGLILLLALMGARGGLWVIAPILLFAVFGGLLYLGILRARAREQ